VSEWKIKLDGHAIGYWTDYTPAKEISMSKQYQLIKEMLRPQFDPYVDGMSDDDADWMEDLLGNVAARMELFVNEEVVATLERLKEVVIDDTGAIDAELARRR
jgi:hypothetical protein